MPKATQIRKSKFVRNDNDDNRTDGVDLFAVSCIVPVDDNSDHPTQRKQDKRQEKVSAERDGAQDNKEKPERGRHSDTKNRDNAEVRRAEPEEDVQHDTDETSSPDRQRSGNKEPSAKGRGGGGVVSKRKKALDRTVEPVKEGSKGTSEIVRTVEEGSKGTGRDRRAAETVTADVDYKKFKLTDFDTTKTLMSPRVIQYGPFPTKREHEVYIIMDDRRYRVSAGSVRNNTYIQGLDSLFLLNHYRPWKI